MTIYPHLQQAIRRNYYANWRCGWQLLEEQEGLQRGGFTGTSPNRMVYTIYPSASENLSLRVHTVSFQPAPTGVRLSLYANDAPPARQRKGRRWRAPDSFEVFPPLSPPPGTRQLIGGGSGGGSDSSHSSATLELEQAIPIEEIQTHYNQQLQQAGWTSIDAGHVEQAAWSNWSFRDKDDEPWSGTFFLLKLAGQKPRYYLQLLAEWNVDRSGPFSGTRTGMNSQGWSYSS
ncbi:MAG TPA: hypothetical protein VKR06_12445 [Ktedonosporobacter sp.]|nr:hypothetical protein [Ktedonosporobacter sp.]